MPLTVTAGQIDDAMRALKEIIESVRPRTIPQMGKYKLAKLRLALEVPYKAIDHQHADLIRKYGEELFFDKEKTHSKGWQVDQQGPHFQAYVDEWTAIRAQVHELAIRPIPFQLLGDDPKGGGIEVAEYYQLDPFIQGPLEGVE